MSRSQLTRIGRWAIPVIALWAIVGALFAAHAGATDPPTPNYDQIATCTGEYLDSQPSANLADALAACDSDAKEKTCTEDMPCWDCQTMGNKVCGPVIDDSPAYACEGIGCDTLTRRQVLVLMCSLYWTTDDSGAVHVTFSDPAGYRACVDSGGAK